MFTLIDNQLLALTSAINHMPRQWLHKKQPFNVLLTIYSYSIVATNNFADKYPLPYSN